MELNHDCIRTILLDLEQYSTLGKFITVDQLAEYENLTDYSKQEITYALVKLKEADFIDAAFQPPINEGLYYFANIGNLTYSGHEFLDSIRDPKIWKLTKEKAGKIGSFALSTLAAYAIQVGKEKLGLQ